VVHCGEPLQVPPPSVREAAGCPHTELDKVSDPLGDNSRKSSCPRKHPTHPSLRAQHARQTGCTSTPQRLSPESRPSHRMTPGGGGSVDRRPLGPGGKLLLVLRVTEVLRGRTWFTLPLVAGATWRTSTLLVLAHSQMEENKELGERSNG
jgi:hypothetical protein